MKGPFMGEERERVAWRGAEEAENSPALLSSRQLRRSRDSSLKQPPRRPRSEPLCIGGEKRKQRKKKNSLATTDREQAPPSSETPALDRAEKKRSLKRTAASSGLKGREPPPHTHTSSCQRPPPWKASLFFPENLGKTITCYLLGPGSTSWLGWERLEEHAGL